MDQKERFTDLFRRYAKKRCTAAERQELMDYIDSGKYDSLLSQLIGEQWDESPMDLPLPFNYSEKKITQDAAAGFDQIQRRLRARGARRRRRFMTAAAVILVFVSGAWLLSERSGRSRGDGRQLAGTENEAAPGGNKAVLTLANGKTLTLDSLHAGRIALQGTGRIVHVDSGLLSYRRENGELADAHPADEQAQYNTLRTPRGGQYRLILPDGSKVWVNSASSIRFPTAFTGADREVEIQGQCYFEIAKNPSKPFKVKISAPGSSEDGTEVLVLGTHFDVMAYPDEASANISLLEGSVKVQSVQGTGKQVILVPGEQARVNKQGQINLARDVDMGSVTAWKDGFFEFDNTSIPVIMRQLARWYDIDIVYHQQINEGKRFGGVISRGLPLSEILPMLKANGVDCQLQNHVLSVESVQ